MKGKIHKLFLALFSVVIVLILWHKMDKNIVGRVPLKNVQINKERIVKEQGLNITILLYTEFFQGPWYLRWNKNYPCSFSCKFTYDKSFLHTATAVGFHDADLPEHLPKRTNYEQIWFYFNLESPVHSKTRDYQNIFNWTMTYRTDSDVFTPYGNYERLSREESLRFKKDSKNKNFAASKTKMAVWISSNCDDSIGRYRYVQTLSRYINVDIYGKCGHLDCTRGSDVRLSNDCKEKISNYKFYLAFENSLCYDYITEKYWENALENELVPVVMGDAEYNRIAIPGSFINVQDFESVKDLADYLKYLDRNDSAYNEFFKWKELFRLTTPYTYGCTLCAALHGPKAKRHKIYPSLLEFWKKDKCRKEIITRKKLLNELA